MNYISSSNPTFVNVPDTAEARRTRIRPGDVLLTITGSKIGRVAPVPDTIDTAFISQHVALLRLKQTLNPFYLSMFLSLREGGQRQINLAQHGQSKPGLNFDHIENFLIPVPSMPDQNRFIALQSKHERLRTQQREALRQAEHMFQTLLHKAFRGEDLSGVEMSTIQVPVTPDRSGDGGGEFRQAQLVLE